MKFTVSMNNDTSVPYMQYGTDRQKANARKFATANDKELQQMAKAINARQHRNDKFDRNIGIATLSLPLIGGVAAAIATKGKASGKLVAGLKSGAVTAGYMALGAGVVKANNAMTDKNPKLNKAERKHPVATFLGLSAAAMTSAVGIRKIALKVSPKVGEQLTKIGKKIKIEKLAQKIDAAPEGIRNTLSHLSEKVTLPNGVKEKISTLGSKIKVPQIIKDGAEKLANLESTKSATAFAKKAGAYAMRNPVTTSIGIIAALIVGEGIKRSFEISATKSKLKHAQLKTANNLNEAYAKENNSLKVSNAMVADRLEEAEKVAFINKDKE